MMRSWPSIQILILFIFTRNETWGASTTIKNAIEEDEATLERMGRLVGGTVSPQIYPWFVRFQKYVTCGAALITPEYVITAAHCVEGYELLQEYFGSLQVGAYCEPFTDGRNCGQSTETIGIRKIFVHPRYNSTNFVNDIALIRLEQASEVTPVAIDMRGVSSFYEGERLFAVGLGKLQYGDSIALLPSQLRHVELSHVGDMDCLNAFASTRHLIDPSSMFCATGIGKDGVRDACHGDSGGPLFDPLNGFVSGIISWGVNCAHPDYPGVYTRVSSMFPWIQKRICKKSLKRNKPVWCDEISFDAIKQDECNGDIFRLDILKDDNPNELNYRVKRKNNEGRFRKSITSGTVHDAKKFKSTEFCVPMGKCQIFKLIVRKQNGLCCSNGSGFYRVLKNGEQIRGSRMENNNKSIEYFGNCW